MLIFLGVVLDLSEIPGPQRNFETIRLELSPFGIHY